MTETEIPKFVGKRVAIGPNTSAEIKVQQRLAIRIYDAIRVTLADIVDHCSIDRRRTINSIAYLGFSRFPEFIE